MSPFIFPFIIFTNFFLLQPYVSCLACLITDTDCHARGDVNCFECGSGHKSHCIFGQSVEDRNEIRDHMKKLGLAAPDSEFFFFFFPLHFY